MFCDKCFARMAEQAALKPSPSWHVNNLHPEQFGAAVKVLLDNRWVSPCHSSWGSCKKCHVAGFYFLILFQSLSIAALPRKPIPPAFKVRRKLYCLLNLKVLSHQQHLESKGTKSMLKHSKAVFLHSREVLFVKSNIHHKGCFYSSGSAPSLAGTNVS